ncbi:hypothetical protein [Salinigranum sp.]|uniref:DUF7524 family protein n=1 Tax=Salinigranum sp. TaxID=1966351 RepID=UPI003563765D
MPASLPVELNRGRLHAVEAPVEFTSDGSFYVDLSNHGEGVHVHLHLDDALSRVARLEESNVFVAGDTTSRVDVVIDQPSTAVTGRLKVSTGYGAETTSVDVTVEPFEEQTRQVAVDESLSKPKPKEPQQSPVTRTLSSLPGPDALPYLAFVLLAVVIAVGAVLFVGASSPAVLVGVGVVLGGAVAALVFIMR